MTTVASPAFTPPSPGAWELEQTHFTKPPSRFMASVFVAPMMRGFRDGTQHYGLLLDYLEIAVINGFVYTAPRPVGATRRATGTPPRLVFELLRRVHPEIRRRLTRADEVFRTKAWRQDVAWWDDEVKPAMLARARALIREDLAACSDTQLADHLGRSVDFLATAIYNHHRFNVCTMLPVGDFLVQAKAWTGMPAGELLQAMRGLSPVSAGAIDELSVLRREVLSNASAVTVLTSDAPAAEILQCLLARADGVGAAAHAYVDAVGLRVLGGYDVADRHAREHPHLLIDVVRTAVIGDDVARRAAAQEAVEQIRARVPEAHRHAFDELLHEAKQTYRLRDERIFHGDALATGIARRAILAAGERLQRRGALDRPEDLVEAEPQEICALLNGREGPSAGELADRVRWRRETPLTSAPPTLGSAPLAPPPAEWLPPAAARMQRITELVMSLIFDVAPPHREQATLKGFGVSPGTYEGRVRVIRDVEELPTVRRGEILVTPSTSPTFNVVLPLIGALVTERGGVLSHAAIVSREYGLPGVVGCAGATAALETGMRVRVDGATGEVWKLN